jgi:hypothetical protein
MWVMISYDRNEDVYYGPFVSEDAAAAYAEANKLSFFVLEPLISPSLSEPPPNEIGIN